MSKMPVKKKSCFQITSVTQAQVAASNVTDDTESLDDPDESRTEDVSSEIFDVSRADMGVCERSSSEETLNNVGETQEGQTPITGPVNGALSYKGTGAGRGTPCNLGGTMPVPSTAQPFVPATHPVSVSNPAPAATPLSHTAPVSTSCSSRFRVIKLDHGTGKSFRRGRWTCTEFYDKDSDSNASANRAMDSIKPTVTLDHNLDRDSGIGATISTALSAQALENTSDSGFSAGLPAQPHHSESLQQGYSLAPQIGSGTSAFRPTGYSITVLEQQQQLAKVNMQIAAPQTLLSNSLNGVHQGVIHKSPIMPSATQFQQFAYSTLGGLPAGQPDYRQQHFGSSNQNASMSALPPTGTQAQGGEASSAQGLMVQMGNASPMVPILPGSGNQLHVSQVQPSGGIGSAAAPSSTTTTSHSSVHNAPATLTSITNTPLGGGLAQPQGAQGGSTAGLPSVFSNQIDDNRWKSDALPQPSASVVPVKDAVKPFIGEGLSLPSPAVNSLFGIHISMNVDEDR